MLLFHRVLNICFLGSITLAFLPFLAIPASGHTSDEKSSESPEPSRSASSDDPTAALKTALDEESLNAKVTATLRVLKTMPLDELPANLDEQALRSILPQVSALATACYNDHRIEEARQLSERVVKLAGHLKDDDTLATALITLSAVEYERLDDAIAHATAAGKVARNPLIRSKANLNAAILRLDRRDAAKQDIATAESILRELVQISPPGDRDGEIARIEQTAIAAAAANTLAQLFVSRGDGEQAYEYFAQSAKHWKAVRATKKFGARADQYYIQSRTSTADVRRGQGRFEEALRILDRTVDEEGWQATETPPNVLYVRAALLNTNGDYATAAELFQQAADEFHEDSDVVMSVTASLERANCQLNNRNREAARATLSRLRERYPELDDSVLSQAMYLEMDGRAADDTETAQRQLRDAYSSLIEAQYPQLALRLAAEGALDMLRRREIRLASKWCETFWSLARTDESSTSGNLSALSDGCIVSARIAAERGDDETALRFAEVAIKVVEQGRRHAAYGVSGTQGYLASRIAPYHLRFALLLERMRKDDPRHDPRELYDALRACKARTLSDLRDRLPQGSEVNWDVGQERMLREELDRLLFQLALSEEDRSDAARREDITSRLESATMRYVSLAPQAIRTDAEDPGGIADFDVALKQDEAWIDYLVLTSEGQPQQLMATVLRGGDEWQEAKWLDLSPSVRQLEEQLGKPLSSVLDDLRRRVESEDSIEAESKALYRALVAPLLSKLDGVSRIVVCADANLWECPFEMLLDEQDQYLCDRMKIAYAAMPGRNLHALRRGWEFDRVTGLLYASAAADDVVDICQKQRGLLQAIYGQRFMALAEDQATKPNLTARVGPSDVLHLFCLGIADAQFPLRSRVLVSDGAGQPVPLEALELLELDLSGKLVVACACETGLGKPLAGEGMVGFAWGALAAGSDTVVAAGWKLPADAASRLVVLFHDRLQRGDAPLDALHFARREVREHPSRKYRHPRHWAGLRLFTGTEN